MSPLPHITVPASVMAGTEPGIAPESLVHWYQHMQTHHPLRFRADYHLWDVFCYEDVQRVLTDHHTFTSEFIWLESFPVETITNIDPPRHRQLRTLVTNAFTPRSIARIALRVREIVDELLSPAIHRGSMELIADFASPLPIRVIAELLGIPAHDQAQFQRWSYQLVGALPTPTDPEHRELAAYITSLLREREQSPRDDLMSALLAAEAEGEHLSRESVLLLCEVLLIAGNVTTTSLIAQMVRFFDASPEVFEHLRADPSSIPGAIEEIVRHRPPVSRTLRMARHDTTVHGYEIKEGEILTCWISAANFDESAFPHAERFDITRTPNPHFSFGHGVHFCLGAPLARLEGKLALEGFIRHCSTIRSDPAHPPCYTDGALSLIQSFPVLLAR